MRFATLVSAVALAMLVSGRPSVTSSSHSVAKRKSMPHDLRARARVETAKKPKRDTTITSSNFVKYLSSLDDELSSDTVSNNAVSYSDDLSSYSTYSNTCYFSDPVSTDFTASTGSNPFSSGDGAYRPNWQSNSATDGTLPSDSSTSTDPSLNRMVVRRRSSTTVNYKYPTGLNYGTDLKRKDVPDVSLSAEYDPSLFRRDDDDTSDINDTPDLLDGDDSTDALRAVERRRNRPAPVDRTSSQGSRLPREEPYEASYSLDYDPSSFDRRAGKISGALRSRLQRKQVESAHCVDGLERRRSDGDAAESAEEEEDQEGVEDDADELGDGENQDADGLERRQSDDGDDVDSGDQAADDDGAANDETAAEGTNEDSDDLSRRSDGTEEADGGDDVSDGELGTEPSDDGEIAASNSLDRRQGDGASEIDDSAVDLGDESGI